MIKDNGIWGFTLGSSNLRKLPNIGQERIHFQVRHADITKPRAPVT